MLMQMSHIITYIVIAEGALPICDNNVLTNKDCCHHKELSAQ